MTGHLRSRSTENTRLLVVDGSLVVTFFSKGTSLSAGNGHGTAGGKGHGTEGAAAGARAAAGFGADLTGCTGGGVECNKGFGTAPVSAPLDD